MEVDKAVEEVMVEALKVTPDLGGLQTVSLGQEHLALTYRARQAIDESMASLRP